MKVFERTYIDHALETAAAVLASSAEVRGLMHRRSPVSRRPMLQMELMDLKSASHMVRPIRHALHRQPGLHRADEIITASAALQDERRLLRRMLTRYA